MNVTVLYGAACIVVLALTSAFFSSSEISLAASRRSKLRDRVEGGDLRAESILSFQDEPGLYFTTVQIGLNAVAILAGIVGDTCIAPVVHELLPEGISPVLREQLASAIPFIGVTLFFVLFADLIPKRIAMATPEAVALRTIGGMGRVIQLCKPLAKIFDILSIVICRSLGLPENRQDDATSDERGTVTSVMIARENVLYFDLHESEDSIREKIKAAPHSTYLVCDGEIDDVVGCVESKALLERLIRGENLLLDGGVTVATPLTISDSFTLSETMESFRISDKNMAVVLDTNSLVVGIVTLKDLMQLQAL